MMLNPFMAQFRTNPYPAYKMLRDVDPFLWQEMMQSWLVTGYEEVNAVLRDHATFSSQRQRTTNRLAAQLIEQGEAPLMRRTATILSSDPPDHTRMRSLVNKAFTPRVVEALRPHIQEICDGLLDAVAGHEAIDVVRDLAVPLPIIVIAELLGVPASEREQFKAWSTDIAGILGGPTADAAERSRIASEELAAYFTRVVEERRRLPREDLISALIAARDQGDLLSQDELVATLVLLLVAGNETTTNLIGNAMLALIRNPEQRRLLQKDPALVPNAVEELLRYDSPVQATARVAVRDAEVFGKQVKEGQSLIVFLGAANHDPRQFHEPERLDLRREDNRHVAFGFGIHYCLGAPLARVEAQIAIPALLRRFPEPETDAAEPDWGGSFILRGLRSLPLRSKARAA